MKYPLTPMQQGMLFHSISEPHAGYYIQQIICTLRERVDTSLLQHAWQAVIARHGVLRSSFQWEGLPEPLQEVHPEVEFEFEVKEIQQQGFDEYLKTDRLRGFDPTKAPLMRIGLFQLNDCWQMVWTFHHCLLDGRSHFRVLEEVFEIYDAAHNGELVKLESLRPFSDYVSWLHKNEHPNSETFWRQQLAGFTGATSLPAPDQSTTTPGESYLFRDIRIPQSLTSELKLFAEQNEVTLNNLVQGSWALLLNRCSGEKDVVIGTSRACRHSTVEGADSMVGLLINTVPFRVRVDSQLRLGEWLKGLRAQHVSLRPYEHTSLMKIQQWSDVPPGAPVFETLLTFENYQIARKLQTLSEQWSRREVKVVGRSNYPLVLLAEYGGSDLSLKLQYETARYDAVAVDHMLLRLKTILEAMVTDPKQQIGKIDMLSESQKAEEKSKKDERRASRLSNLMGARRQAVNLSEMRGVKTEYLSGKTMPLVFQPEIEEIDLVDWARNNRESIDKELLKHGSLLFRGFGLRSPADFEKFAEAISPNLFAEYGDLPREGVGGKVYGSTPYPSDQMILFHNESSHMHRWPMRIWFFCVQPSEEGGETPIVDCRRVYQLLDPKLKERFVDKKLMYVRNYIDGLDVSWQTFFRTTDKSVVEDYCRKSSIEFEWNDDRLRTKQICPAIVKHPQTDEMVFFNQLQLHHVSCLEPAVRESLLSIVKEEDLPRNVYYGDGSPIEDSVIQEVRAIYDEVAVAFPWQKGDVMMLNNMLIAHGRNPYVGARKIVVAMGEMVSKHELD
jgi:alpha-ketoglutarate-dependent taurine dioxygenase